ncbi:MAG: hypothetical protein ACK5E4_05090 [Planctomycetia bacterium]|jgi:hypothetical protein
MCLKRFLFALVATVAFHSNLIAQDDPKAVIQKAIDAQGGKDALVKAQKCRRTSSGVFSFGQTQNFSDEFVISLPDKLRLTINLTMAERLVLCMNGDKGWSSASGIAQELPKEKIAELKDEAYFLRVINLVDLLGQNAKLASLPESKVNGAAVRGVKASIQGGTEVSLYFDKITGLLSKAERKSKQSGVDVLKGTLFSDYKSFGPVKMPTSEAQLLGGNKIADIKNIQYTLEATQEDSLYQLPSK